MLPISLVGPPSDDGTAVIAGRATRRARLKVDIGADGTTDQALKADRKGRFQFTIHIGYGTTPVEVIGPKSGRRPRIGHLTIIRPDTRPPSLTLGSPSPGALSRTEVAIGGRAADAETGLASVHIGLDGGSDLPIAFDAAGNFSYTTTLALDGSADGAHALRFRATDAAGNTTTAEAAFTLDTRAPSITPTAPASGSTVAASPAITGVASDAVSGVTTVQAQVDSGPFAEIPVDPAGRFTVPTALPRDGTADGLHTVRLRATDRAGNPSGTETVTFVLDTTPPPAPAFDLDRPSDTAPVGDGQTRFATVSFTGQTEPGAAVTLVEVPSAKAVADASGRFAFAGIPLAEGVNTLTVRASDAVGNTSTSRRTITRLALPQGTTSLVEGNQFLAQASVPVELGQAQGTRTIRFGLDAGFDTSDRAAAVEDTFLVYLVDPADPSHTLLDRGRPGTALFALAGNQAEFSLGLVRYDGASVEIDVTSLAGSTAGMLVFQLINSDADTGTVIHVLPVSDTVDPDGIVGPVPAVQATDPIAIGPARDLTSLASTSAVGVLISNVRLDAEAGRYTAELRLRNDGPAIGRQVAVAFPGLPGGVSLLGPSGVDGGSPYVNFETAIAPGGLAAGATSEPIEVTFSDPQLARFALHPTVRLGPANRAPVFDPIGPLSVMPGHRLEVPLAATDPDGDPVTFAMRLDGPSPTMTLDAAGKLTVTPQPDQLGTYSLRLVASDGALEATRSVTLTVAADPVTTTRISGRVLDTDGQPLAGLPVELGRFQTRTDADGHFLLELPASAQLTSDFDVLIPQGDVYFDPAGTGLQTITLRRAVFDPATGTGPQNPREQVNQVTSLLDANVVYGSDPTRALALRSLDGTGHLKTSPDDLLPFNSPTYFPDGPLPNDNEGIAPASGLFVAGDVRSSENTQLAALHTILLREHNRLADGYHAAHPDWDDEQIYQAARRMVGAVIQAITYNEFIPALLGPNALPAYTGYDTAVDPRVSTMFSTVAFRVGHTLLTGDVARLGPDGQSLPGGPLSLRDAFFNVQPIVQDGLDPYLRGLVAQRAETIDNQVIDEVRNFLFGPPGSGGMDLPALNIQRGRDEGLPDYNTARADFGLPRVTSFAQITSDTALQAALLATYGSVDKIDPWVGGVSEDHLPGAAVGPFFAAVLKDQFRRTRDGDRFWYENGQFSAAELAEIRGTSLAALIERNSGLTGLPANVFTQGTPVPGPAPAGTAGSAGEWRSIDGSGNNPSNPNLGKTGSHLLRNFTGAYADGIAEPSGADRPNARAISNTINAETHPVSNADGLTMMAVIWGQLLDHDLSLTPGGTTDTIKFHGEALASDPPRPFVAEKLPLMLGQPVIPGVENVIARPVYLPGLNAGMPVDPGAGTMVHQELRPGEAEAQVFVQAGTLQTRTGAIFAGNLSITEVPSDRTPAALPPNVIPDTVVSIQPAEMVFTQPAPLTLPNRSGLSPGILLDLWSINPITGQFEVVGQGRVSDDGRAIETISGGIRTSSWHFFALLARFLEFARDAYNQNQICPNCPLTVPAKASNVELHSGDLMESHALVPYQSLGTGRGVELDYDTGRLANNRTFFFRYPDLGGSGQTIITGSGDVETRLEVEIRVHGDRGQATSSFSEVLASAVQGGGSSAIVPGFGRPLGRTIVVAMAKLPTGYYTADLTSGVFTYVNGERRTGSAQTESWSFVHVNTRPSSFGAGWGIAGLQELVVAGDGSVVLVDGGGAQWYFQSLGGGAFRGSPGDSSTFRRMGDGTYRRTMTDGMVYEFAADGLLTSVSDRNANRSNYSYDGTRRLTAITDPVGLRTDFVYDGSGKVSRIVDPMGRATLLDHDAAGNLTRITDPDGTSRRFSYDGSQRMTGEINQSGFVEQEEYDRSGRVIRTVAADGSVMRFVPAQSGSGLGDPTAYVVDANGNTTAYVLDQAGQMASAHDAGGTIAGIARNSDNRVTRSTDGRGNSATFEYDGRGNVVATESHGFLASDSFSTGYVGGDLAGQGGGSGWGGAWQAGVGGSATDVSSTAGLTGPGVADAPGGVRADGTSSSTTSSRSIILPSDGTVYLGFLANFEVVSSGDPGTATALWLGDRSESSPEKLLIGRTFTATPQYSLTARDDDQPFSLADQTVAIAFGAASTDGALDATFGAAGIVRTNFGSAAFDDERITSLLVQPDGRILAVGYGSGSSGIIGRVARYNPDGTLDPSFSGDGLASFSTPSFRVQAAALQPDGKIVAIGDRFEIARMNADGSMDNTFGGGDGWVRLGLNVFQSSYSVAVQADGKILAGGEVNSGNPTPDFALARCNSDGTVDTTFGGGDGVVTTNTGGYPREAIRKILVQSDGTIIVVGQGGPIGFALVRYKGDGTLDGSFGSGGIVTTNVSGNSLQTDVAVDGVIQPDGKIIVAGTANKFGNKVALVRYSSDGSLDSTFGTGGKVTSDAMPGATGVVLLPDGKFLVGGSKDGKFALARFLDNGSLDTAFGAGGVLTTDVPGATPDTATTLALQGDEKAILGGYTGNRGDFALARYTFAETPPIAAGSTHHLVVRIDFDAGGPNAVTGGLNDRIRLYVDPVPGFEPPVADAEIDDRNVGTLDLLGFTAQGDRVLFDELRLGTGFAEVFDVAANGPDRPFVARQVLSDADGPGSVAIGDVNADGHPDLVHTNSPADTVSIRLGDGQGGFGARQDLAAPGRPDSVALVDLDGDSRLDIVSTNLDADSVSVWLAAAGGGFRPRVDYATADRPDWVEAGDVNGDGRPDLVILCRSRLVSVLLNDGAGAFLPRIDDSLSGILRSSTAIGGQVALGDLDHDGHLDAAIGTYLDGQVALLFGDGTGHFSRSSTLALDGRPDGVAMADINGDGNLDLAVGRRAAASIAVFLGDGTGAFPVRRDYDAGNDPARVLFTDVNADGKLDLVHTNAVDSTFSVRLGDGTGAFGVRTDHAAGFQPSALATADLDGDDDRDLVIGSVVDRVVVFGNQALAPDPDGQLAGPFRRTYTYDPIFSQVTSMTDELGHRTLYDVNPANGNVRSITEIVGRPDATSGETDDLVTRFTYTSRGLVHTITDPLGRVTQYDYNGLGRLILVTDAVGTPDEASQSFAYDAAGNTLAVVDENGHRTAFEYDALNRVTRVTEADPDGSGPLPSPVSSFDHDAKGNVVRTTDAQGHVTAAAYDAMDRVTRVTDEQGNTTRPSYDATGNLVYSIDPLGHVTESRYDGRNRPVATIDPDGGVTSFRYDAANNMTSLTDPVGNVTHFVHDFRNRLIQEIDPLGKATRYAYDATDNLVRKTDRLGRVTEFVHDDLDRLTTELWRNADGSQANRIDYAYDAASNLTSVADSFSALAYTYDARDRVRTVDNAGTPSAPHVVLEYTYDDLGNVLSVTDTIDGLAGATTAYAYDALNRTTRITQAGANVSEKRVDFAYNAFGQYTSIARFADLAGLRPVVTTTYQYDNLNRLTDLRHSKSTGDVAFYQYTYDASSRIASINDIDGLTTYTYDDRDQLTGADRADGDVRSDESYQYDANGNRVASSVHGTGYVTGPGNRLLSDGTYNYAYDGEGNMTLRTEIATGATREFQWDHRNRLVAVVDKDSGGAQVQRVAFTYDGFGRRLSKEVVNAVDDVITRFVYDREGVILDFVNHDGPGPQSEVFDERYLQGPGIDQGLAQENGAADVRWLLSDHLGTDRDLVNNSGAVVNHIQYASFGAVVSQSDPTASSRYLFTGREYDPETDLYYYRARYYDAAVGRFVSPDPIGFNSGDSNEYRIVSNQPASHSDPTGLDQFFIIGGRMVRYPSSNSYSGPSLLEILVEALNPIELVSLLMGGNAANAPDIGQAAIPNKTLGQEAIGYACFAAGAVGGGIASRWIGAELGSGVAAVEADAIAAEVGPHTVFRRDPVTGKVTHYETRIPQTNPRDPNPWQIEKRVDVTGSAHYNKALKEYVPTPHVHDPMVPGGVRPALPSELPQ